MHNAAASLFDGFVLWRRCAGGVGWRRPVPGAGRVWSGSLWWEHPVPPVPVHDRTGWVRRSNLDSSDPAHRARWALRPRGPCGPIAPRNTFDAVVAVTDCNKAPSDQYGGLLTIDFY